MLVFARVRASTRFTMTAQYRWQRPSLDGRLPATTTEPPVSVTRSATHNDELHNGSGQDQQQQQDKSGGRCGAQSAHNVVAAAATSVNRAA